MAWLLVLLILYYVLTQPSRVIRLATPLVYPLLLATLAYALSAGNAGTGFRYRSHLLVLMIAIVVVMVRRRPARRPRSARARFARPALVARTSEP